MAKLTKIFRFAVSGALSALVYFGLSWLAVRVFHWGVWLAGAVAYVAAMPVAYLLHKWFTFAASGKSRSQVLRFIFSSCVGVALSSVVPAFFVRQHMPLNLALALTCVLVPAISYVLLSAWVFSRQESHG